MRTVLRHPFKLHWYELYSPLLFDMRVDRAIRVDLSGERPELTATLLAELEDLDDAREEHTPIRDPIAEEATERDEDRHVDTAEVEAGLRALGYLEAEDTAAPTATPERPQSSPVSDQPQDAPALEDR